MSRVPCLCVLIPTLDEEKTIGEVIKRTRKWVGDFDPELVVVDGGSSDSTPKIAREMGCNVIGAMGGGKGSDLRDALERLEADVFVMLDGDMTYPPKYIPNLVEPIFGEEADVVVGSRFLGEIRDGAMSLLHYIGNKGLTFGANLLFSEDITDVCSGMWAFSNKFIREAHLGGGGFNLEAQLFAEASKKGYAIKEVPIEYLERKTEPKLGKDNFLGSIGTGLMIAKTLISKRLGLY